jgi:hypothetical protein
MGNSISIETLANEIRRIYQSDPSSADLLIEAHMKDKLKEFSSVEKLNLLEKLTLQFESLSHPEPGLESKHFSRLFSLLFGERISAVDLSSQELLEKLAHSLNTIFDTLNQIISVINTTLLGKKPELETIRHIIGSDLEGEVKRDSLQNYLAQIQEAFLVAHKAFQEAAHTKVGEILKELSPDHFEASKGGWLKLGPLRKAELFEIYKEKFKACRGWFESGRFMEELLREFEKTCQKLYNADQRKKNEKIY